MEPHIWCLLFPFFCEGAWGGSYEFECSGQLICDKFSTGFLGTIFV
jgi:hypothetical protein